MRLRWPWIGVLAFGAATGLWALSGEADVQIIQNHVVEGAQEGEVDETLAQGTLTHSQPLFDGLKAEGTVWASLDTLPSQSSLILPPDKLAFQSKVLEGWLTWEPLPGTLNFGAGKLVIHPSSGFSHTPLDFVPRGGETLDAQAASAWEEGWIGAKASWFFDSFSVSTFYAPALSWDTDTDNAGLKYLTSQQSGGFVQSQLGLTLGSTDLKALAFQGSGRPRLGFGLDSGWGDSLTFRAELAADTDPAFPQVDSLAGLTWTNSDQSTIMAEFSHDETGATVRTYGFLRGAGKLDHNLDADVWTKVNLADSSGWLGSSLTYTANQWALSGYWLGAWGAADSDAGSSPLRWQTTLEVKAFF